VFPEATFTPVALLGRICDLTPKGARIRLREISEDHARRIINGPRFCRLFCQFSTSADKPTKLFGKILNFNHQDSSESDTIYLGVDFGENEEADLQRLREFLDTLEAEA